MTAGDPGAETRSNWMIYGAYGYTGRLIAEEAVRRGHHPVLSGRSQEKLIPLARRLGLDWVAAPLDDVNTLAQAVGRVELVLHAAGPFIHTSDQMVRACLAAGANYLDVTGEIPVFRNTFSYDRAAIQRSITLISGVGFDVISTDCMADYVAAQVPNAVELEVAVAALEQSSPGTTKTMLEMIPQGGLRRRDGELRPYRWGKGAKNVSFIHGERTVLAVPWGDLETAYQTTGIPNITAYLTFAGNGARLMRWIAPVAQQVLKIKPLRRALQRSVEKGVRGPDAQTRRKERSYIWARAADLEGNEAQAWLETLEGYQFTAVAGVRFVERVLAERPVGALTPSLAFGADFILQVEGTQRFDVLPTST